MNISKFTKVYYECKIKILMLHNIKEEYGWLA